MLITSSQFSPRPAVAATPTPKPSESATPGDRFTFSGREDNDLLSTGLAIGAAGLGSTLAYIGTTSSNPLISIPSAALSIAGAGAVIGGSVGLAHDLGNHSSHEDYTKKGLMVGAGIGVGVGATVAALTNNPFYGAVAALAGGGASAVGAWIASQS